jgi:hypothetical protein
VENAGEYIATLKFGWGLAGRHVRPENISPQDAEAIVSGGVLGDGCNELRGTGLAAFAIGDAHHEVRRRWGLRGETMR